MGKQLLKTSVIVEDYNPFYSLFFAIRCPVLHFYAILRGLRRAKIAANLLVISRVRGVWQCVCS